MNGFSAHHSLEALQTTVSHCFPGWLSLHTSPSAISLLPARLRDRVPMDIISLSLLPISMCFLYLFLCKSCSISLSYFPGTTSLFQRCRFSISLGGGCVSRLPSYIATLDQNPIYYSFISPFIPSAKIIFHIRKWS